MTRDPFRTGGAVGSYPSERRHFRAAVMAALALLPVGVQPAASQEISAIITSLADGSPGTLREAIDEAPAGSTLTVTFGVTGTYLLDATLGRLIVNGKTVNVHGPGKDNLVISGGWSTGIFYVSPTGTLNLNDLTLTHGRAMVGDNAGGALRNDGTANIRGCDFKWNAAVFGGAVANRNVLYVRGANFEHNYATGPGGALVNAPNAQMSVHGSNFVDNYATGIGGGGANAGAAYVGSSAFVQNRTPVSGGGYVNFSGGMSVVNNTTFSENEAFDGAALANDGISTLWTTHATLTRNTATRPDPPGGAISNFGGEVRIKNGIVGDNVGGDCANNSSGNDIQGFGLVFVTDSSCGPGFIQTTAAALNLGPLSVGANGTWIHLLAAGSIALDKVLDPNDLRGLPITRDQEGDQRPSPDGQLFADAGADESFEIGDTTTRDVTITVVDKIETKNKKTGETIVTWKPTTKVNLSNPITYVAVLSDKKDPAFNPANVVPTTATATAKGVTTGTSTEERAPGVAPVNSDNVPDQIIPFDTETLFPAGAYSAGKEKVTLSLRVTNSVGNVIFQGTASITVEKP